MKTVWITRRHTNTGMVKTTYNHLSLADAIKMHTTQAEDNPVCLEVWKPGDFKPTLHSLYEKDLSTNKWIEVALVDIVKQAKRFS